MQGLSISAGAVRLEVEGEGRSRLAARLIREAVTTVKFSCDPASWLALCCANEPKPVLECGMALVPLLLANGINVPKGDRK